VQNDDLQWNGSEQGHLEKHKFEKTRIKYLGIVISYNKVEMDPVKIIGVVVIQHIQSLSMESLHWYNIIVKLTKYLQFWHISHNYLNLRYSTTRISMQRILTLTQNFYDIKKKTSINMSRVEPVLIISNYFIITLLIALLIALYIDFPLLGIVSYFLHLYILVLLIAFAYAMCLKKY
jgi:hypothetical protein